MNDSDPATPPLSDSERESVARGAMRRCWAWTGGAIAATGLALASCAPAPPPPAPPPAPAPAPVPTPLATPTITPGWEDAAVTPGNWSYRADASATRALYGPAQSEARFVFACELGPRQIRLWRAGTAQGATTMTVTTTSATRILPAQNAGTELPYVSATLPPHDPLVDALVFSRGRIAIAVPGMEVLTLPNWAEIARVAEDCR